MALTFPEPQRPGKTWDLHVIVQCLLEQSGEGFILFFFSPGVGSWSSRTRISEHPPRLLPGDTQGERVVAGAACGSH